MYSNVRDSSGQNLNQLFQSIKSVATYQIYKTPGPKHLNIFFF